MILFHSAIWSLYGSHPFFHVQFFPLEWLLALTAVQCTEKPESRSKKCPGLAFANRYEFIAGAGF